MEMRDVSIKVMIKCVIQIMENVWVSKSFIPDYVDLVR